jgi:hypothetical protein
MKVTLGSFCSRSASPGSMFLFGVIFVSFLSTIGKTNAGFWWSSTQETKTEGIEKVEKGIDAVSRKERRALQTVKWLSRAGGGEEEDKSCDWNRLGVNQAACEMYVCAYMMFYWLVLSNYHSNLLPST